jgi:ABC-type lipoprotein release transport system permease subunit
VVTPIAVVLLVIMAVACALPIRRAVRLDPVATLRQD